MQKELKSLNYKENYEDLLPSNSIRISPSSVAKFNDKKHEWYRSQILGEELFSGNTFTHLGTLIHRAAELAIKTGIDDALDKLKTEANEYIPNLIGNPAVDTEVIYSQYEPMANALLEYFRVFGLPQYSEQRVCCNLVDNIYLAGTYDAIIGNTLIDFKTTNRNSPDMSIPYYYKWQMLAYAYALRKNSIEIGKIRLLWITHNNTNRVSEKTGNRLKDYPSQVIAVTEVITDEDMRFIEDYLMLIAETVKCGIDNPHLVYMLFSDYRLKQGYKNE